MNLDEMYINITAQLFNSKQTFWNGQLFTLYMKYIIRFESFVTSKANELKRQTVQAEF